MIKKHASIIIIPVQVIAFIWFLWPYKEDTHLPIEFMKMLIFGGIALFLLIETAILYAI